VTTLVNDYQRTYQSWHDDPRSYWAAKAGAIDWTSAPRRTFDADAGPYGAWFPDGELNVSHNCLDRHIDAGHGDQAALVWDSAMTKSTISYTYRALRDRVAKFAGALAGLGVTRGDRVVIYMPMVPEAAVAMLACARLGAIHSVVFGGFAAPELASRVVATDPKILITATGGLEPNRVIPYLPIVTDALALAGNPAVRRVVLQRPEVPAELSGSDIDFLEAEAASAAHPPVPVAATDPLYLLHTSGTTARPKGLVRDCGGHAVALADTIATIFGLSRGDVFWAASDVGWVVGHSYIVYAPLLAGLTTVMYEGKPVGTPDAGAFWRVAAEHQVSILFTAPTAIRAIRQHDSEAQQLGGHDLSSLKAVYLAGERCDPPTAKWLAHHLQRPVVDNWWQTETGWPITARFRGLGLTPFKPGSGGRPSPGYEVAALDDAGAAVAPGSIGNLALRLPLPPGCAPTMWQDDDGYRSAYLNGFPGWYRTGDNGMIDDDGDVWVMGRTDDVINVAGHRLSTGAIEEILQSHPDVAESAVFGQADPLKGEIPLGLVVLKQGSDRHEAELGAELVQLVRERLGAVASFRDAIIVGRLPKTRSGKILRAAMRELANGNQPPVPPTIEDPQVLTEIRTALDHRPAAAASTAGYAPYSRTNP
jgi:propionyl-CoA synthetase